MTSDLHVLSFPDYRGSNPYQQALAAALEAQGVTLEMHDGKAPVLPLTRVALTGSRPDVVHVHFIARYVIVDEEKVGPLAGFFLSVLFGLQLLVELTALRLAGIRLIWTAHDLLNHERRALGVEKAVKHIFVRALCDTVIVHCDRAGDLLVETFALPEDVRRKLTVVPHGHFLDHYENEIDRAKAREALGIEAESTVFLFFGWIRRYKNVVTLVETFRELDAPDARLLVVGNPRTDRLEREVRVAAGLDDRVRTVLEFVPDEEIQTYMNAADVVVLPFRTGRQTMLTSGSVVLAMGFGRPIVTPRLGCVECLVDGGGVLYDRDRELGHALSTAMSSNLAEMGARNRRRIERFDWESIALQTTAVYADDKGHNTECANPGYR